MVLLIEKDCKPCQEVIKNTFMHKSYLVSKDQKSSYPIEMLYTFTYPTLFFLDNRELFICKPIRGEISPDKLKSYLEQCK